MHLDLDSHNAGFFVLSRDSLLPVNGGKVLGDGVPMLRWQQEIILKVVVGIIVVDNNGSNFRSARTFSQSTTLNGSFDFRLLFVSNERSRQLVCGLNSDIGTEIVHQITIRHGVVKRENRSYHTSYGVDFMMEIKIKKGHDKKRLTR